MKTTARLLLLFSLLTFPGFLPAQDNSPESTPTPVVSTPTQASPKATASLTPISEKKESKLAGTTSPNGLRAAWTRRAEANTRHGAEVIGPDDSIQTLSRMNKTLVVKGNIQGATSIIHGDFFLFGNAQGPISVLGGNATILGKVYGPVSVVGGDLNVGGEINGNASVVGGSIVRAPGAVITGHTSTVGGIRRIWREAFNINIDNDSHGSDLAAWCVVVSAVKLAAGALWLAAAALLAVLIPATLEKAVGYLQRDAVKAAGIGLLFWIVFWFMTAISGFLCLLLIGFPMLGLLTLLYLGVKWFGITVVFLWTGRMLCTRFHRETTSTVLPVVIGGIVIVFLRLIPCLGSLLWLAIAVVSAGISMLAIARRSQTGSQVP